MIRDLPTPAQAKQQANRLREELSHQGTQISHAQALERVAQQHGFRDWNTLSASLAVRPTQGWDVGDRVTGRYLSQRFAATVLSSEPLDPGWFRLTLRFDEAVDVVRFAAFSNLRKQVNVVVGPKGHSRERTSDGEAHVVLDL